MAVKVPLVLGSPRTQQQERSKCGSGEARRVNAEHVRYNQPACSEEAKDKELGNRSESMTNGEKEKSVKRTMK